MFKRFKSRWALAGKKRVWPCGDGASHIVWVGFQNPSLNSGEREIPINHIEHLTHRKQRKIAMLKARKKFNTQHNHMRQQYNNLYLRLGATGINIELNRGRSETGVCVSTSLFRLWSSWTFFPILITRGLWESLFEGTSKCCLFHPEMVALS